MEEKCLKVNPSIDKRADCHKLPFCGENLGMETVKRKELM